MSQLKQYWAGLQGRERRLISVALVIAALLLAYVLIWEPWHKAIDRLHSVVPQKRVDLKWMQAHQDFVPSSSANVRKTASTSSQGILTVLENVTSKAGLRNTVKQMSPGDKSNEARLRFSEIEFNKWLKLTGDLKTKHNINVESVSVQSKESGIVNVNVTFARY